MKINHIIKCCSLFVFLFCLGGLTTFSIAQTQWYKYPGKIEFKKGPESKWDAYSFDRDILYENNEYRKWYEGWSYDDPGRRKFGIATSPDGILWEKHAGNPLDFDDGNIDWVIEFLTFDVIRKDSLYLMWFAAETKHPSSTSKIGFAWSADGFKWNAHPEPVLIPGKGEVWDGYGVTNPNVLFDGKIYHMWYSGIPNRIPKKISTGYATSTDGIHWKKHPDNPVLKLGEPGSWDDHWVVGYSVTTNGSLKELWYFGYNQIKFEIGLATSLDGVRWSKAPENPILKAGKLGEWDAEVFAPRVIKKDSVYRMWYSGYSGGGYSGGEYSGDGYATTSLAEAEGWERENIVSPQRTIRVQVFNRLEYIYVDSLSQLLPKLSGTALIDAFNKLALAYSLNNDVKSYFYAEKALEVASAEDYPQGRAMALYSMGNSQYVLNNYTDALVSQLTALRIFDSLDMQYESGNLLSQIASIHSFAGSHELACKYHQQALDVFAQLQDTASLLNALNYLGKAFLDAGDNILARKTFGKELVLAKETGKTESLVYAYEGLGRSYQGHLLDSGIYYIMEARKNCGSENSWLLTTNSLLMAETYLASGPPYYAKAEEYLNESFELLKLDIGGAHKQLRWLYGMAELQISTGRHNEAKEYLDLSLELCRTFLSKHDEQVYESLNEKLEFGVLLNEYMEKIYLLYNKLDIILKDKDAELEHFMLATAWRDSVINEQAWKKVATIQANYEMEISENQISILEKENEVQNLTLKRSKVYLFGLGAFALIVILGAIIFIRNRKIRAQHAIELERLKSEKLLELDHLKSRFFANISHEFRTPLTLIMGPIEKLLSKTDDGDDRKDLGVAKKYAGKLQILINNLLVISKLESGKMQLRASELDIVKLVRTYLQAFESLAKQKSIELQLTTENKEIIAFIDREKFEQALNNLLSNAFKFTGEGGKVEVEVYITQSAVGSTQSAVDSKATADWRLKTGDFPGPCVSISVSDTGPGISHEHIDHIFDRFYQVEQEDGGYYEGTGIGLALTKELVELHHGTIKVDSEMGKGSSFTILIPLGIDHLKPEEIINEKPEKTISPYFSPVPSDDKSEDISFNEDATENNDVHPILLIAEDNADMRSYIREYFENEYQVIEAVDGLDAYEKAIEQIPDIIISDVMMPRMDGNEFCRKVKTDERTSHIPVILLTARASKESRIEGIETGADDFISKPFDGEVLQLRVKNLISQRQRIRNFLEAKIQASQSVFHVDFADSGITSMDERFLQKVIETVRKNYADPQFDTTTFGQTIGLGRIQLNRKIKTLTGQTTVSFIRAFRLNCAAELLKKKSATIAEIAFDVGFSSPSYFTECFQRQFGKLPSEFMDS